MILIRHLAAISLLMFLANIGSGQRLIQDISNDWDFSYNGVNFTEVNLPHSYNMQDPFDDDPGYYRGKAFYRKVLDTRTWDQDLEYFIKFYAVNQQSLIALNGKIIGGHKGGYTAFVVNLNGELNFESDTLTVLVDNSHDDAIIPLKGDFNFYGGIYRQVEVIGTHATHFDPDHYGADGVFIDPLEVTRKKAMLRTRVLTSNFDPNKHQIVLEVYEPSGKMLIKEDRFEPDPNEAYFSTDLTIKNPDLWSVDQPDIYQFRFGIIDRENDKLLDELIIPYGLRYFSFDADKGFFLNGEHLKLIGVNRHQDRPNIANALTTDQHIQDMDLIREMGANFLRTAHYPQDQSLMDYCDRNGILVTMEIPLDHEISDHPEFLHNCKEMMLEMIHQYYNHPSVIIWAYMNEMGLWKDSKRDREVMEKVVEIAGELEQTIRTADPFRYTMIPNHGYFDIYLEFGLTAIPMIIGWNLYYGWYVPDIEGFGRFIDRAHKLVPDKPIIISEYGAGADPRISSLNPKRFDFSVNWALEFHRSHLQQILERDYIAGSAVWNMFDFGSELRNDAVPHINNKGLCGFDRIPKPLYFLYQKHLRPELKIEVPAPGPAYVIRSADELAEPVDGLTVKVYDPRTFWESNSILNVNFGTDYYFSDQGLNWLPDSGVPGDMMITTGAERAVVRDTGFGTDRSIARTLRDPVYQTWVEGIDVLRFYVPAGQYRVIVHLSKNQDVTDYEFKIRVNDNPPLSIPAMNSFTAYQFEIEAVADKKLDLRFIKDSSNEMTFINGIQLIRL
jgi:beta-galactosidase